MSLNARVLIVARDDALAGPLAEGLDRLGWRTVTARGPYAAGAALADLQIEVAILDLAACGEDPAALARRLKQAVAPRRLPVVAIGDPGENRDAFDLTLAPPLHPAQAAMRLETLARMSIAEEELELRAQTFADRQKVLTMPPAPKAPYRILAVGEPAPQFLALSNALTKGGGEVVGAFTAYTAFDYLHERAFDAVALWGGEDQQEALSIAAGMRRNTRLYHIPAMLYLKPEAYVTVSEAFHRGISDIASPDTPETETAARILELARCYRRQSAIRQALEKARASGLMDAATGLFTKDLFAAHLARIAAAAKVKNRPLSVCILRIADTPDVARARAGGWLDKATPQIGSMIGRLVRAEDTAARLRSEVFALALPGTTAGAARSAGERIAAVIACTAFDAGEGKPPFVAEFDVGVAQVDPDENPAVALERAAAKTMPRQTG